METKIHVSALSGNDAPDALAVITLTPEAVLNLRSARKLVLDHGLVAVHISAHEGPEVVLVNAATPEAVVDEVDVLFDLANSEGLDDAPQDFLDALTPYEGGEYGEVVYPEAWVVTPGYAHYNFGSKHGSDTYESGLIDLGVLLGEADEDNQ